MHAMTQDTEKEEAKPFAVLPAPHVMNIQFARVWNVASPYVYRYEDQKWIDEFFDSARLRLSTFAKFATYKDEARGDTNEGKGVCFGQTSNNWTVIVAQAQGSSAAVLCCSLRLDDKLKSAFNRDSAFQITNTVAFGTEIARHIPGFRQGLEGSCIYRADTIIKRQIDFDMEKYKRPDGTVDMKMIVDATQQLGGAELILLKRKKYQNQQEYRVLWEVDKIDGDYIDIVAPNARQFCRKLDPKEWSE